MTTSPSVLADALRDEAAGLTGFEPPWPLPFPFKPPRPWHHAKPAGEEELAARAARFTAAWTRRLRSAPKLREKIPPRQKQPQRRREEDEEKEDDLKGGGGGGSSVDDRLVREAQDIGAATSDSLADLLALVQETEEIGAASMDELNLQVGAKDFQNSELDLLGGSIQHLKVISSSVNQELASQVTRRGGC